MNSMTSTFFSCFLLVFTHALTPPPDTSTCAMCRRWTTWSTSRTFTCLSASPQAPSTASTSAICRTCSRTCSTSSPARFRSTTSLCCSTARSSNTKPRLVPPRSVFFVLLLCGPSLNYASFIHSFISSFTSSLHQLTRELTHVRTHELANSGTHSHSRRRALRWRQMRLPL